MKISAYTSDEADGIKALFSKTFTNSEGESEGAIVGGLAGELIPPPFKLSQPEGWMAQSLVGGQIDPIQGKSRCVEALNKPEYW